MKFIKILIVLCLFNACTGDYSFKDDLYTPRPVVMSMISPDSFISVTVSMSVQLSQKEPQMVNGADVVVKEDGVAVAQGKTVGGVYKSSYKPVEGKSYELLVNIAGLPPISAVTSIPVKPFARLSATGNIIPSSYIEKGYLLVKVDTLRTSGDTRGIWLSSNTFYTSGKSSRSMAEEYYGSNYYFDQLNASTDPMDVLLRESNVIFDRGFIRIARENIVRALPFTFSFSLYWSNREYPGGDRLQTPVIVHTNRAEIYFLAASEEYDRFRRSVERQWHNSNSVSPLAKDPASIQSNVKNGLGVFGGYSVAVAKVSIKKPRK